MKLKLEWPDGESRIEYDVTSFGLSWNTDEWVCTLSYRDGSEDVFTGRDLRVVSGEEIHGQTIQPDKEDYE